MASRRWQRNDAVAALALAVLCAVFFCAYATRFAGLASGAGEFRSGMKTLAGQAPILTSYSVGPPFNALKAALELRIFGETMFVTRLCGVAERMLIALLLYVWLRRIFSASSSFVAALVTIVVASCDLSDPIGSYNHDAILLAMLCGLCCAISVREKRLWMWALAAGFFAGCACTCKQTIGGLTLFAFALCVPMLLLRRGDGARAMRWFIAFCGGAVLPIAAVCLWLLSHGRLGEVAHAMFVSGPAAKAGTPGDFLLRIVRVAEGNVVWIIVAVVGFALAARAIVRGPEHPIERARETVLPYAIGGLLVLGVAVGLSMATSVPALWDFSKTAIYFCYLGVPCVLAVSAWRCWTRSEKELDAEIFLFALCSAVIGFALALSWPAFEAMVLPGLGLLVALTLDGARRAGRSFALLVVAALVFLSARDKLDRPFAFNGVEEPAAWQAVVASDQPMLRHMRFAPEEARFLDATVFMVKHGARAGDTLFTYPEMGLMYTLTGLEPPTVSDSHNVDVVNDVMARQEAERLLTHPPRFLIWSPRSDEELRFEDAVWRHGQRSGQWDLQAAVSEISRRSKLVATYRFSPDARPVQVYIRP